MEFEYDKAKSDLNLEKHGIDFEEAQALWDDRNRVEFRLQAAGEKRFGVLARYAGCVWLAVTTLRGLRIRIVFVRRATLKEASFYDKENNR